MWNLKIQQTSEYNKKRSRLTDTENKLVVTSWGRERRGNVGIAEWEVQTIGCKLGPRMYRTTQEI